MSQDKERKNKRRMKSKFHVDVVFEACSNPGRTDTINSPNSYI